MGARLFLELMRADFDDYAVFPPVTITITERQAAFLWSLACLLTERVIWEDMTDSEWDALEGELSTALELLDV